MDRPHRESRQHNGITVLGLPQPTFTTKSALFGHGAMSDLSPLSGAKRKTSARSPGELCQRAAGVDQPLSGPRPQLSTSCSQNGRSFQQLKAVIEFDGLVEVTTMRNLSFGLRRLLSLIVGLTLWAAAAWPAAAEPSAALRVGRRSQRRLRRLDGETVPQAGQYRLADLFGVHRRPQERALARYLLRPQHEATWYEI